MVDPFSQQQGRKWAILLVTISISISNLQGIVCVLSVAVCYHKCAGVYPEGGPGVSPRPPFLGTPKLHEEGKKRCEKAVF